jgi:hypothetical protein
MDRLTAVLSKAVDVSVESITKETVKECFGADLYAKLGGNIEGSFSTLLGKTQKLIDTRFNELSEQRDLNSRLTDLENTKPEAVATTETAGDDDILSATVMDIQKMEAEHMKTAIAKMESDMEGYGKKLAALRAQLGDQKGALMLEHDKFRAAAEPL